MNLLNRIASKRKDAEERPIMFATRNLGGIVVKRALVEAKLDDTYKSVRDATYGITFSGTLHQGGNFAKLGDIAVSIVRGVLRNPSNSFMEALIKDSLFSNDLADDYFRYSLEDYHILSFFETILMRNCGQATYATVGLAYLYLPHSRTVLTHEHLLPASNVFAADLAYKMAKFFMVFGKSEGAKGLAAQAF